MEIVIEKKKEQRTKNKNINAFFSYILTNGLYFLCENSDCIALVSRVQHHICAYIRVFTFSFSLVSLKRKHHLVRRTSATPMPVMCITVKQ